MSLVFAVPLLATFILTVLIGPKFIPFLHRLKFGQTVRDEGPESHKKKNGTPTMGGLIFLSAMTIVSLFYIKDYPETIYVLTLTLGFGFIGFLDDFIKVIRKNSTGLKSYQKMALQIAVTSFFIYYTDTVLGMDLTMKIPFMEGKYLDLGFFNIILVYFVVIGTDTGTNFTDGIDGLCTSVTAVIAGFFAMASFTLEQGGVMPVSMALLGGLMGFLVFNAYPAKVFMGDTGALALGGYVAACAYIMHLQLFLLIIGLIYVAEVASVMIQVSYFKLTHGKRVFKMTPIHHHFELSGWSETKVVAVFTIITIIGCAFALEGIW